jgi:hypothetical protein
MLKPLMKSLTSSLLPATLLAEEEFSLENENAVYIPFQLLAVASRSFLSANRRARWPK